MTVTDSDITENREQDKNILLPVLSTFKLYSALKPNFKPAYLDTHFWQQTQNAACQHLDNAL